MSKRAEERARQAFPGQPFIHDRCVFKFGYEQAEKDIKDALLEWAKEKAELYKGTANIRRSFEMMIRKIESL